MHYTPLYNLNVPFNRNNIDKQFLVNKRLLDVFMHGITQEQSDSIPQPRIIIGSRGTGKSWILKALYDLLKENHKNLSPCFFDASIITTLEELYATIKPLEKKVGRIVVLADNADRFFSTLPTKDQYALRGKLNTNGAPIFICSASRTPKALTDYSSAFFDGFDIQYIDKLPIERACDILEITTDKQRNRAERLFEIVGTEIRNIMLVKNILCMSSSMEKDRQVLFDYIYESMMNKISSLPKISQQIVNKLSQVNNDMTLAELRESIGLESSKLSPYITQLVGQGILTKDFEGIRKSKYRIADKLLLFFLSHCSNQNQNKVHA